MFGTKQKEKDIQYTVGKASIIGSGVIITGDIESNADIRIDGILTGNIKGHAKVVIGDAGEVKGNIEAREVDNTGKITGSIIVEDLIVLRDNAYILGDITAKKMSMEPTVTFNGKCVMKTDIPS